MPTRFLTMALSIIAASLAFVSLPVRASGQDRGGAGPFPSIQRVTADYPDDTERFIVFNLLFTSLGAVPGKQSKATFELYNAYAHSAGEILSKYEQQGRNSETFKRFDARSQALFTDRRFKQSVLDRYHLASVSVDRSAGGSTGRPLFPENGDPSDAAIRSAFFEAAPVWIAAVILMLGLAWVLMRSSGCAIVPSSQGRSAPGRLPQLPESLRVISVPGRRYEVEMECGQVLDKETMLRNNFHTTTTTGPVYVQDGVVHQGPSQTQTSVTTSQEDLIWVRTADARETSWTLFGGAFKTRQGHIVSSILRPLRDGTREFLLAYNHTTGQLADFNGLQTVHATYGFRAWILAAFFGSLPGAFGLGMMFHTLGGMPAGPLIVQLVTLWVMAGFASALVAVAVVFYMRKRINSRRNQAFMRQYLSQYREFFTQATPALVRHFNS